MGDILLDFRPEITTAEIAKLERVINDMHVGDQVSITLEREDAHQSDKILEVLRSNNYDCQTKGGHQDEFYIKAKKKES